MSLNSRLLNSILINIAFSASLFSQAPIIRKAVIPLVPPMYRILKESGSMVICLNVDNQGQVTNATVKKSFNNQTGIQVKRDELFANDAFRLWIFEPNKPGIFNLSVTIRILSLGTPDDDLKAEFEPLGNLTIKARMMGPEVDPAIDHTQ